jgi:hypothetical protein
MLPFALAVRARVHLTMRQPRDALPLIEEAIRMLDEGNVNPDEGESLIRLVWVETLEALGRLPEAARALVRARARLHERARLIERPDWRESFLGAVSEHARIEALSREWDAS